MQHPHSSGRRTVVRNLLGKRATDVDVSATATASLPPRAVKDMVPTAVYNIMVNMLLVDDITAIVEKDIHSEEDEGVAHHHHDGVEWKSSSGSSLTQQASPSVSTGNDGVVTTSHQLENSGPGISTDEVVPLPLTLSLAAPTAISSTASPLLQDDAIDDLPSTASAILLKFAPKRLIQRKKVSSVPAHQELLSTLLIPPVEPQEVVTAPPSNMSIRDAVLEHLMGPTSYIARILLPHMSGEDVIVPSPPLIYRPLAPMEANAHEMIQSIGSRKESSLHTFQQLIIDKCGGTNRVLGSKRRRRETTTAGGNDEEMTPTIRESYTAAVVTLCLHVTMQPLLEYNTGPQALLLCQSVSQCMDLHSIMAPLADTLHIVVHNAAVGYPVLEERRRPDILIGCPLQICQRILPRTNDCKGVMELDSQGRLANKPLVFQEVGRNPKVALGPLCCPQELSPGTMYMVNAYEGYYTLSQVSQIVSFVENISPSPTPSSDGFEVPPLYGKGSVMENHSEALLRLIATDQHSPYQRSVDTNIRNLSRRRHLSGQKQQQHRNAIVQYNYSGQHSGILPSCQFLLVTTGRLSEGVGTAPPQYGHLLDQHYVKPECSNLAFEPTFIDIHTPNNRCNSHHRLVVKSRRPTRPSHTHSLLEVGIIFLHNAFIHRNHQSKENNGSSNHPSCTVNDVLREVQDEVDDLITHTMVPFWNKFRSAASCSIIGRVDDVVGGQYSHPSSLSIKSLYCTTSIATSEENKGEKEVRGGGASSIKLSFLLIPHHQNNDSTNNEKGDVPPISTELFEFAVGMLKWVVLPHFKGVCVDGRHAVYPSLIVSSNSTNQQQTGITTDDVLPVAPSNTLLLALEEGAVPSTHYFPPAATGSESMAPKIQLVVSGFAATAPCRCTTSGSSLPVEQEKGGCDTSSIVTQTIMPLANTLLQRRALTTPASTGHQLSTCLLQEILELTSNSVSSASSLDDRGGGLMTGYSLQWIAQQQTTKNDTNTNVSDIVESRKMTAVEEFMYKIVRPTVAPLQLASSFSAADEVVGSNDIRGGGGGDDPLEDDDDGSELLSSAESDCDDDEDHPNKNTNATTPASAEVLLLVHPILLIEFSTVEAAYSAARALHGLPIPSVLHPFLSLTTATPSGDPQQQQQNDPPHHHTFSAKVVVPFSSSTSSSSRLPHPRLDMTGAPPGGVGLTAQPLTADEEYTYLQAL